MRQNTDHPDAFAQYVKAREKADHRYDPYILAVFSVVAWWMFIKTWVDGHPIWKLLIDAFAEKSNFGDFSPLEAKAFVLIVTVFTLLGMFVLPFKSIPILLNRWKKFEL